MREDEAERKRLLWPEWSTRHNGPQYDSLDDETKAVWRQTRGQRQDEATYARWIEDLVNAVHKGLVTEQEATEAIVREGA